MVELLHFLSVVLEAAQLRTREVKYRGAAGAQSGFHISEHVASKLAVWVEGRLEC